MNDVHYSSRRHEWETPQSFFDAIDTEFNFTLDACATEDNTKCPTWISPEEDALTKPWIGVVWMNPPYGYSIGQWVKKAYDEAQKGSTVVALVPARTDTRWWHEYAMNAVEIRLIRGRLSFLEPSDFGEKRGHNAPFPNALIVFRQGKHTPIFSSIDRISV